MPGLQGASRAVAGVRTACRAGAGAVARVRCRILHGLAAHTARGLAGLWHAMCHFPWHGWILQAARTGPPIADLAPCLGRLASSPPSTRAGPPRTGIPPANC